MKIMITGAAGWLGRRVTARLEHDHDLLLTDSADPAEATIFDGAAPGGRRRVPLRTDWPYLRADLADTTQLERFAHGADAIIHLAAIPVGDWNNLMPTMQTNVMGTTGILELVRRLDVRRFVNASSINAFGTFFWRVSGLDPVRRELPLTEDEKPVPEDPYSLTKFLSEQIGHAYHRAFGTEVVNLRFAGVIPNERYQKMITDGLPPTESFPVDLGQWVHEEDVAAGIVLAVTRPTVTSAPIVLGAADTRLPEPTMEIIRRFRPDLEPYLTEPLPSRAPMLSITRARTRLEYQPQFSFDGTAAVPSA
ncbi:NAD(P)-dependent oxidoreductase [Microlunatus sp. Gsoil 973]|uniref:NAD-dependent epimerase/dehydratase family protein n=1 Tax=Microlunatus sp. Gsoil 973 TaxID=2672569 RepID=UPI0012B4A015|nr:NAD(P)-dependent oxidoreductase [Microlunatus sp. Gsoil 973]QGN34342.1 NAD-dependent epimerase/dehydratase family protein [Microlunatus sp. Gsoil 973]